MTRTRLIRLAGAFSLAIFLWWALRGTLLSTYLVPDPIDVGATFWSMTRSGEIFTHLQNSFRRVLIGFALGSTLGFIIGAAIGASRIAKDLFTPAIAFFRNVPPVALVPLVVSLFGIGETGKYFIISYAAIFVMAINVAVGINNVPVIRMRAARCLGASRANVLVRIILPSAWPYILSGLRVALGFSFMSVVAAEMLAASSGIGFLIMQSTSSFKPKEMFVGFALLSFFGLLFDWTFRSLVNRFARRYMISMGMT